MSNTGSKKIVHEFKDQSGKFVKMTDTVVILPLILGRYFGKPLWNTNPSGSFTTSPLRFGENKWINKGDVLINLRLNTKAYSNAWGDSWRSFFSFEKMYDYVNVSIRSPVSGIILDFNDLAFHYDDGFFPDQLQHSQLIKILLSEDEVVPENAGLMYTEFCDFCLNHRELFFNSEYPDRREDIFLESIEKQSKAPIRTLSLSDDFSEDYIEELVTLKSSDLF